MEGKQKALVATTILLLLLLASPLRGLAEVTLSVSLTSFFAVPETSRIVLRWETASEIGALGFNVWRGTSCNPGTATRLNASLIPAEGDDQVGGSYEFADDDVQPNVLYDYRLEEVETDGTQYCFIEPEFQVQASLSGGNPIVTPTQPAPGGGAATSTPPAGGGTTPGSTAQPSPTSQPGQPQVTTTAAVTVASEPAGTGTSQPGANATPSLQLTPGLETPGGQDEPGAPGVTPGNGGEDVGAGAGSDPAGEETGETPPSSTGAGNEGEPEFEVLAEGGGATAAGSNSGRQVIGANVPADSLEAVSGTALESTDAAETGSAGRRPLYIAMMVGGLLFALGGIIATSFLAFRLQAK